MIKKYQQIPVEVLKVVIPLSEEAKKWLGGYYSHEDDDYLFLDFGNDYLTPVQSGYVIKNPDGIVDNWLSNESFKASFTEVSSDT